MSDHPLIPFLQMAVPLWMVDLALQGRPNDEDFAKARGIAKHLGEYGDAILYRVPGKTADAVNRLCEGLAILAAAPGGVKFGPLRFDYQSQEVQAMIDNAKRQRGYDL